MVESKSEVTVTVQNVELVIRTDKSPEYVKELAEFVDERIKKISQSTLFVSSLKVSFVAAIDLANELFELRQKNKEIEDTVKNKTEELVGLLEEGIK
ncbi:MAG: cell division protein ZapA [Elusimicrobia bacterium]|nr:cell division protein ZapA [Elusimicrobiota bacterium]